MVEHRERMEAMMHRLLSQHADLEYAPVMVHILGPVRHAGGHAVAGVARPHPRASPQLVASVANDKDCFECFELMVLRLHLAEEDALNRTLTDFVRLLRTFLPDLCVRRGDAAARRRADGSAPPPLPASARAQVRAHGGGGAGAVGLGAQLAAVLAGHGAAAALPHASVGLAAGRGPAVHGVRVRVHRNLGAVAAGLGRARPPGDEGLPTGTHERERWLHRPMY